MFIQQGDVIGIGHCKRMVGSHQPLFLIAPFEQREIDDPQTLENIFVAQSETATHLKAERA